jgi:S-formylglutathione hydrolase FrmB
MLSELRFFAPSLGMHVSAMVLLPDNVPPPWPTFYLLHGLSDDHTIWTRRTRIEAYAEKHPFAIVMPNGFRGFYTTNADGPDFFKYIHSDVINACEKAFRLDPRRERRCIGGLSMGGYGALRVALARPDLFISANSHSGALGYASGHGKPRDSVLVRDEMDRIFGPEPSSTDHDLLVLAERCAKSGSQPRLLIDCGTEDFLIDQNRDITTRMKQLGLKFDYVEHPGVHNWDYWDTHVRTALQFHADAITT